MEEENGFWEKVGSLLGTFIVLGIYFLVLWVAWNLFAPEIGLGRLNIYEVFAMTVFVNGILWPAFDSLKNGINKSFKKNILGAARLVFSLVSSADSANENQG